jgi:hypothetical protein
MYKVVVTVVMRSKAGNVFAHPKTAIVGSIPTRAMDFSE